MRENDIMRLLAGIGGIIALIDAILGIDYGHYDSSRLSSIIISIVLAVVVLLSVLRPGDPIPMNWLLYVGIGIVIIIFSSLPGGILVLIAGFVGYTVVN